jgi:hypothetical protein
VRRTYVDPWNCKLAATIVTYSKVEMTSHSNSSSYLHSSTKAKARLKTFKASWKLSTMTPSEMIYTKPHIDSYPPKRSMSIPTDS